MLVLWMCKNFLIVLMGFPKLLDHVKALSGDSQGGNLHKCRHGHLTAAWVPHGGGTFAPRPSSELMGRLLSFLNVAILHERTWHRR
jgi:hypothetical protein